MRTSHVLICTGILAFFVTACAAPDEENSGVAEGRTDIPQEKSVENHQSTDSVAQKPETLAARRESRQQIAEPRYKKFEERPNEQPEQVGSVRGEVPDEMLEKVIDDLAERIGADRSNVEVIHAESLNYSDGSLGCGKPGQNYTYAIVPGYRIILSHAGQQFDYRATRKGYFMLCEKPMLAAPGARGTPPVQ